MANVYYSDLRAELDIELRDSDNFTFTVEEKDHALKKAIEDTGVGSIERDTSLVFTYGQAEYDAAFTTVTDIGYDPYGNGGCLFLSHNQWQQVGDKIIMSPYVMSITNNTPMFVYGVNDTTKNSGIPQRNRPYIIAMAVVYTLDMLKLSKVNRFLRNDATMAEMSQVREDRLREARSLKGQLKIARPIRF